MEQYWLVKTEPGNYSWDDLVNDKSTFWDGVRNYQARNFMKEMKKGDRVLVYHSVNEKRIMGIAEVIKEWYQDPTTDDDRWVAVDIQAVEPLENKVTLAQIKSEPALEKLMLVRNSRLSVMPVSFDNFHKIVEMSKKAT
jgi:predicted RNA-binding protein with PUA-like domain